MSETEVRPRRKRGKGVPLAELEQRYPSLKSLAAPGEASKRSWVAAFNVRPDAMHALLADFIKQVYAKPGRIGQRPMPREEEVDFQGLVYGQPNDVALVDVLPGLMKALPISERSLATRAHLSRTQLQRLMRGEYQPDVNELRTIAGVLGKPPVFFVEYRKAMAIAAFVNLIDERPGIATSLYLRHITVNMGET